MHDRHSEVSGFRIDGVANEVAMRRELVVQASGAVVVQPGVPIETRPSLALHFGRQPADQLLADTGRALHGIHEQVPQVADRREPERVFVDDVVGDADDAVHSILGDDRMDGRCVIQDARPRVAGERLRERALVEQAVAVEQLAPALLVLRRGPANNDRGRKRFRHKR
jgi:hypothetical protein